MPKLSLGRLRRADVVRGLSISAAVGTLLLLLNHGDHLLDEPVCEHFYWKLAGCYLVPLAVSVGSVLLSYRGNGRRSAP